MKIDAILFLILINSSTGNASHFRGAYHDKDHQERNLKSPKGVRVKSGSEDASGDVPAVQGGAVWPTQPVLGQDSDAANRAPATTNLGSARVGNCCDGPAQPQPASPTDAGGNRVPSCTVEDGEGFKPTFRVGKKHSGFKLNNYITNVPREYECGCNDHCANQDGTSMICCFKSHYFIATDNKNIQLCVDLTGITEAAMAGCVVTPDETPVLLGDPLDVALPIDPLTGVAVDPNK